MNLNTFNAMYILYKVQPSTLCRSQLYAYQCQLLSPHALSAQCTPSMFCSFDEYCAITAASLQIFFSNTFPPWFDVKSSPLKFFWSICSKLSMV